MTEDKVKNYKNVELVNEDFSTAELPKLRNDFIAKLENALMFLSYKDLNMWTSEATSQVNLKNFDGAWLVDVSLKHEKEEGFTFRPFGDLQVTPDMFPKLNMKMMSLSGDIGNLFKYRFLDHKEKRHLTNYRYIFSQRTAMLDYGKQKWWMSEEGYGFNNITRKEDFNIVLPVRTSLKPGYFIDQTIVQQRMIEDMKDVDSPYMSTLRSFHIALQLSLTYYYEWSCYIKEKPDSIGVRIPIHPSSSKEVFIMRNIPEGKTRKRAIVNFVKDHYRTITDFNNKEREILIKKHLRGDLKFNWRGLEVHITPSPHDLKKYKPKKKILQPFND